MAARYWVGGTASWDATAGTKWSTTDGGPGGAAVPTSADDVYFTAASGAVVVTLAATANCLSINFTGFTGTFTGTSSLGVQTNITLSSGMTCTFTGTISIAQNSTITSYGKTLGPLTISTAGTTTSLNDALTLSGALTVTAGTFTTNNYAVTASSLSSSNSNARTINLGSSTVTLSATGSVVNFTTNTNLTFNAGTSQIICTGNNVTITGGAVSSTGLTFYNVSFTAATSGFAKTIQSSNTFNNLSIAGPASAGVMIVTFDSPQTINGTLSTTGTAGNRRVWFQGVTYGLAQTLTINSAPSLTDADFRDIYVVGTAAPISGTRIGDLRGCRGITFDAPKTVYWNLAAGGNWSANAWAATSGGAVSTDNFPLAQDTATFVNTGLNSAASVVFDTPIQSIISGVDMSARTSSMTLNTNAGTNTVYGDWKNGSGTTVSGVSILSFSGRNTQTITSAGKTFAGAITVDSYGGTVQLADALNIGTQTLTVTNGTFTTNGYAVIAYSLSSSNSNVRTINLGASTVTLSGTSVPLSIGTNTNLTFNAGTSQITFSGNIVGTAMIAASSTTFYNVSFTGTGASLSPFTIGSSNVFNNFSISPPASAGITKFYFSGDHTINGTFTCAGSDAVHRVFIYSSALGTTRTLTVNSLSANDCDFRDITIAGAAAGTSPTRAGDCGGNSGITFPAPKTVYWNLAGSQNWSSTGWATTSTGTPAVANFPLAQDTATFTNAGSVTTVTMDASWNIGSLDMSNRTNAMTFATGSSASFYGNWTFGTGVTQTGASAYTFSGRGTQTITSNGVSFSTPITVDSFSGTVQLADALTIPATRTLTLTSGTFDAVSYNVTTGLFNNGTTTATLKMGSGTWTLSGTGNVWAINTALFYKGTANIVLSDTSGSARTFLGNGSSYNKLTIGGATGISTTTISANNQFTELASSKTVAHTIAFTSSATTTIGKWSVTGTAGNVVTIAPSVAATTYTISIAGAAPSGIDYLSISYCTLSTTSPAEFYVGVNSTNGTGNTGVTFTATPSPRTLYWVGGTGNWNDTAHWSTSSGGASGAAIPTSLDAVNFNSASNATAYTVTVNAASLRCGSLTMAGPASGNVTWAGTNPLYIHGSVSLAATGITRTFTGAINLTGAGSNTFTTNGVVLSASLTINGVGSTWTLGSAGSLGSTLTVTNGTFDTSGYSVSVAALSSSNYNQRTISFGSSAVSLTSNILFTNSTNLTFNAGTSTISVSGSSVTFSGGGLTFYDVALTASSINTTTFVGENTFNNVSIAGRTSVGISVVSLSNNQTINGTLTLSAGASAIGRTFVQSDTLGTPRTLTCNAVAALQDIDFRDITIAGNAVSGGNLTGTRLGDCKGNTGITFDSPKTVYWAFATSSNWGGLTWSLTNGGATSYSAFPLAQDTAVFTSAYPNAAQTVTINAGYNIGTIDMSDRTSNTMTLATGSTTPTIYGNWVNGTGTTLSGTGIMTFAGRGSQTITSAGVTFTQPITVNSPSGSVTLQDALVLSQNSATVFQLNSGTFSCNNYNMTLSGASAGMPLAGTTDTRAFSLGSGTLTIAGTNGLSTSSVNFTFTGSGTISLTSASAKNFIGGGLSYSGITLNQGGAGTLTISGNNTFGNITNTYSATGAANITIGTSTQTLNSFTATGAAGKVLTVQGSSASSPGTLILNSGTVSTVDYLKITGIRAYSTTSTWYAGANSTNFGSLGWIFSAAPTPPVTGNSGFFFMMGC